MSQLGRTGSASSIRWRDVFRSEKGKKAMALLTPVPNAHTSELMMSSHIDSEALRKFAERFRRRRQRLRESTANFELDRETGDIFVNIVDDTTGRINIRMSPEDVEKGLKELEETTDNESSLSSFFIDIEI